MLIIWCAMDAVKKSHFCVCKTDRSPFHRVTGVYLMTH